MKKHELCENKVNNDGLIENSETSLLSVMVESFSTSLGIAGSLNAPVSIELVGDDIPDYCRLKFNIGNKVKFSYFSTEYNLALGLMNYLFFQETATHKEIEALVSASHDYYDLVEQYVHNLESPRLKKEMTLLIVYIILQKTLEVLATK